MANRIVVVTGASGVIGRHLCDRLRRDGWTVRAMMRRTDAYPFTERGIERVHLDLPGTLDHAGFRGAAVVIHAAYATRGTTADQAREVNEAGSARVFAAARAAGARIVFLSSFSAATEATSPYAHSKRQVETLLDPARDLIVRAALVLAADGGMARRLWDAIARFHVAPLVNGGRQIVQTIHIDDLCQACVRAIDAGLTGVVHVGEPDGLPVRDLFVTMARSIGAHCLLIPIPTGITAAMLRVTERIGLRAPVSRDNILGLRALRHVDTAADLERLGLRPRLARESIAELAPAVRDARR